MYECFHENSLYSAFKEASKLSQLILTSTTASAEKTFSASLKRTYTCLHSTQGQQKNKHFSLLFIEKELLLKLKQKKAFYDDVVENFIAQKRRIELCL